MIRALLLFAIALAAYSAQAQAPDVPQRAPVENDSSHQTTVTRVDGATFSGRLSATFPELILDTSTGEAAFGWAELLRVAHTSTAAPPWDAAAPLQFELSDGARFPAAISAAGPDRLELTLNDATRARVPNRALVEIRATTLDPAARRTLDELRATPDRVNDTLVVQRNDRQLVLEGIVLGLTADGLEFEWRERKLPVPWSRVAGLIFATPQQRSVAHVVTLTDGSRFAGRIVAGNANTLTLRALGFDELALPLAAVAEIECRSERLTYLSDLRPTRYAFTPFIVKQWPLARDETLLGNPLLLAGTRYRKGIALHSRAVVEYALDARYRQFAARVGIADEMNGRGAVAIAIIADNGRVLWQTAALRGDQTPKEILVDITRQRTLTIEVDFGPGLDLSDHVIFAEARLLR